MTEGTSARRRPLDMAVETIRTRAPWVAGAVGLFTVPKSGTQWTRLVLANYLARLYAGRTTPIAYHEMHETFLPNAIDSAPTRYFGVPSTTALRLKRPHPMLERAPFTDIVFGHICDALDRIRFPKLLLLYRNPLDNFVSVVHYGYFAREGSFTSANIPEIVPLWGAVFIPSYLKLRKLERDLPAGSVLALSYEAMVATPRETFEAALRFADLPVDADALTFALDASSLDAVRRYEETAGPIHQAPGATLAFARSGRVGQWKTELAPELVERIVDTLDMFRISLDEFVVDLPLERDTDRRNGVGGGDAGR